jgi:hypothetical protein
MNENIKVIIDNVGRFIIGKVVAESDTVLSLKTPVILHVQPSQTGQLQVQTIPLFFGEFVKSKDTNVWDFAKSTIACSNVELDDRLISQYQAIANPSPIIQPTADPQVIKLFDD